MQKEYFLFIKVEYKELIKYLRHKLCVEQIEQGNDSNVFKFI